MTDLSSNHDLTRWLDIEIKTAEQMGRNSISVPLGTARLFRSAVETRAERCLGNLLAIIHGDGGHYQAKHGDDKATADAIAKYYATRFDALCPHGMPLAENICGPCSQGRANRPAAKATAPSETEAPLADPTPLEDVWELMDHAEENAQTGEVAFDADTWRQLLQIFWDLGGRYEEELRSLGWSPVKTGEQP